MPSSRRLAAVAALVVLAAALSACGRKGKPEYPAGTQMEKATTADGKTVERPKKPQDPFVLDGLLN
jgi:predicted small lipoprotein YifL